MRDVRQQVGFHPVEGAQLGVELFGLLPPNRELVVKRAQRSRTRPPQSSWRLPPLLGLVPVGTARAACCGRDVAHGEHAQTRARHPSPRRAEPTTERERARLGAITTRSFAGPAEAEAARQAAAATPSGPRLAQRAQQVDLGGAGEHLRRVEREQGHERAVGEAHTRAPAASSSTTSTASSQESSAASRSPPLRAASVRTSRRSAVSSRSTTRTAGRPVVRVERRRRSGPRVTVRPAASRRAQRSVSNVVPPLPDSSFGPGRPAARRTCDVAIRA